MALPGFDQTLPAGTRIFLHQAFRCCPYAGTVSSQLHDYLERNGFLVVADPAQAEVHLLNTCGSDARQAQLTWDTLAGLPTDRRVVVAGCLVKIEPAAMERALAPFAQVARFEPRHLHKLDALFSHGTTFDQVPAVLRPEYSGNDFSQDWAHILASTGCIGTCAFCAIRRATGRPQSRDLPTILDELHRAVAGGVHDILLVSTDLSAWGTDRGQSVVDLLDAVAGAPGDFLVSGESFEPTLFLQHLDALLPILASGRFAFIGLPLQSGNARVLTSMSRTYHPADVLDAVRRLKAAAPELLIRTDLLYGFGEETEAEFEDSLVASRAFDLPSFNAYQPRPGTAPLSLPPGVIQARGARALAELHDRAQAGLPPLRRWGRVAPPRPVATLTTEPWDLPEGKAWIASHARRFHGVIQRGPITLGEGWSVERAAPVPDAVVLTLRGPGAARLELGLRDPAWPGEAMARTPRYAILVRAEAGFAPTPAQDRALKRLVAALTG